MRMLLNVKIPHQPFNAAVKDGTAGSKLSRILEAIKPEAVYFTEQNGQRGAVLIVEFARTHRKSRRWPSRGFSHFRPMSSFVLS